MMLRYFKPAYNNNKLMNIEFHLNTKGSFVFLVFFSESNLLLDFNNGFFKKFYFGITYL